jgi:tellurite resistance protein TerC
MLVAPGPALVVIPIGLGILALEFAWAGRLLQRFRAWAAQAHDRYTRRRGR